MGKQEPVKVQQREAHSSALGKTQSPAPVHDEHEQIVRSLAEKYPGDLKREMKNKHCSLVVKMASSVLGCIRTSVTCRLRFVILNCSSALVRPPLVYYAHFWALQYKRLVNILGEHLDRN